MGLVMYRLFTFFVIQFLLLINGLAFSFQEDLVNDIATGVTYRRYSSTAPQVIHVLEVDPNHVNIIAVRANDDGLGRETVGSMARRYGAIAAVNGGYYEAGGDKDGLPSGT